MRSSQCPIFFFPPIAVAIIKLEHAYFLQVNDGGCHSIVCSREYKVIGPVKLYNLRYNAVILHLEQNKLPFTRVLLARLWKEYLLTGLLVVFSRIRKKNEACWG